ncbi:MAG: hypothetical protein R3B72_41415 [Polyangiaceae bacterium]
MLAAVMAFADEDVAEEENDMLNDFADPGLSEDRANELLDEPGGRDRATTIRATTRSADA